MPIFVGVPITEWDIFGGHFDKSGAGLGEAPCQKAAEPETAGVISVVYLLWLERQIKGFRHAGCNQPVSFLQRALERFLLIVAAVLYDGAGLDQLAIAFI